MKLLAKAILYYLLAALLSFGIGGSLIYFNTNKLIHKDIENFLVNREEIATTQIVNGESISSLNNYEQKVIIIPPISKLNKPIFTDTLIYDIIDDKYHPYLQLSLNRKIGKQYYHIEISKSLIETKLLVGEIFTTMLFVFIGLIVLMIVLNLLISRNMWRPFKDTLKKLKNYKSGQSEPIKFKKTNTYEFSQLNEIIEIMMGRIRNDYLNLKEFTENASHEILTPLAIIKSKTDMLMQLDNLNEHELNFVKAIYDSTVKLSRLNQGLILLAKIENQQYGSEEKIDLNQLMLNNFKEYKEMADLKEISIRIDLKDTNFIQMNANLSQVLITNLLRNAIKHTKKGGKIELSASQGILKFLNSGDEITNKNFKMFERFQKQNSESLGLGLSIVKKICDRYFIKINYQYSKGLHEFTLLLDTD